MDEQTTPHEEMVVVHTNISPPADPQIPKHHYRQTNNEISPNGAITLLETLQLQKIVTVEKWG